MGKSKKKMLEAITDPQHIGRVREWDDKGRTLRTRILKRVALAEKDYPQINVIDLIEFIDYDNKEVRFGYYTTDRNNRWVWGQYCPCYKRKDLKKLLKMAERNGVL